MNKLNSYFTASNNKTTQSRAHTNKVGDNERTSDDEINKLLDEEIDQIVSEEIDRILADTIDGMWVDIHAYYDDLISETFDTISNEIVSLSEELLSDLHNPSSGLTLVELIKLNDSILIDYLYDRLEFIESKMSKQFSILLNRSCRKT